MRFTRSRRIGDGASRRGRTRTRLAFGAESLESRRLLSMAGTNPLANLPTAVAPPSASVAPTSPPTVAAPSPTGAATSPGAAQFGNAFGIGQVVGFGGQAIGVVENIYVFNIEQGVGASQPSYGLTELDLFIGIGSTGASAPSSTFAPSSQAAASPSASQVSTTPTISAASTASTMTLPATSSLAFLISEFIVASQSAATQAALSGAGAAATAPAQGHSSSSAGTALVGQATSSVTIFGSSILSATSLAGSFLNSSSTSESGTTSLVTGLSTPFAPTPARPPQPMLLVPDTSKLRGHSATPEGEDEPPVWRDLLNAPHDTWMSMPPLHLSRLGVPGRDPSGADRVWDSAVSALMADQVESMASATPEQLPTLGETSETISPIESALAAGLAVTAWVAWERRTRGSDRLRQRQTPDLTFDTLQ